MFCSLNFATGCVSNAVRGFLRAGLDRNGASHRGADRSNLRPSSGRLGLWLDLRGSDLYAALVFFGSGDCPVMLLALPVRRFKPKPIARAISTCRRPPVPPDNDVANAVFDRAL